MIQQIAELLQTPWAILLALLFLSASIFVHELGHFLAARWRGLQVDRFSIGFGPRILGWKHNGVDWRISAIPLGGYVSLPQLADMRAIEGEHEGDANALPPISYTDKVIVSSAGAVFNVLFALLLGTVLWWMGRPEAADLQTTIVGYAPETIQVAEGVRHPGPGYSAGIRPGDKIVSIDGYGVNNWTDVMEGVAMGSGVSTVGNRRAVVVVERDGEVMTFNVTPEVVGQNGLRHIGLYPKQGTVVGALMPESPAVKAGLQTGDEVVAIDGIPIYSGRGAADILSSEPVREHILTVLRDGKQIEIAATPGPALYNGRTEIMLGVAWAPGETVMVHENPIAQVAEALNLTVRGILAMINPRSDIGLSDANGPLGIIYAYVTFAEEGLAWLLFLTLLINVNLAIVNMLPVPVLDGGHIMFATIEKLNRRPVPIQVLLTAQNVFMLLILGAFLYITFHDIGRVFTNPSAQAPAAPPVWLDE